MTPTKGLPTQNPGTNTSLTTLCVCGSPWLQHTLPERCGARCPQDQPFSQPNLPLFSLFPQSSSQLLHSITSSAPTQTQTQPLSLAAAIASAPPVTGYASVLPPPSSASAPSLYNLPLSTSQSQPNNATNGRRVTSYQAVAAASGKSRHSKGVSGAPTTSRTSRTASSPPMMPSLGMKHLFVGLLPFTVRFILLVLYRLIDLNFV